jgi:hypothetical protein
LNGEDSGALLDDAHRRARQIIEENANHVAALAALLVIKGQLHGGDVAAVLDRPPPSKARLGLFAAGVVQATASGGDWLTAPRRCSRQHYDRQVEAAGTWYRALVAAARTLFGRQRVTWPRPSWGRAGDGHGRGPRTTD